MVIAHHRAAALIEAATSQLQILASQVDVRLVVTQADGVVQADADRVVQTLINLLDNAIKFSPRGTRVEIAAVTHGDLVEFHIRDEGRGIPADKLDKIFSRFEQVDSSDAREKGGSGLGLAISRSVVERLGGRLWVESVEGAGSTFHFTLPRSTRGSQPVPLESDALPRVAEHQDLPHVTSGT
jgi:signal transduction histidine kinase